MNAQQVPYPWQCTVCTSCHPTKEAADACCQPKPKPEQPLDFAGLRESAERLKHRNAHIPDSDVQRIVSNALRLIDMAERCEAAEKERDRPKSELADIKSASNGLTANDTALVEFFRGGNKHQRVLVAIIDRLASAAPRLNWRQDIPVGTLVVYANRDSEGVYYCDVAKVTAGGVQTRHGFVWLWTESLLAIPFAELVATLPGGEQPTQQDELSRLRAAVEPFATLARTIPADWPAQCPLRIDQGPDADGRNYEWLAYHGVGDDGKPTDCDALLPTIGQWRMLLQ